MSILKNFHPSDDEWKIVSIVVNKCYLKIFALLAVNEQ